MSKELEALDRLCYNADYNEKYDDKVCIENAFENYDDIKHICNDYGIEFNLSNIREALFTFAQLKGEHGTNWNNCNKKLKALEIIKEKEWFDDFMKEHLTREWFTKEEYDLLKEVFL